MEEKYGSREECVKILQKLSTASEMGFSLLLKEKLTSGDIEHFLIFFRELSSNKELHDLLMRAEKLSCVQFVSEQKENLHPNSIFHNYKVDERGECDDWIMEITYALFSVRVALEGLRRKGVMSKEQKETLHLGDENLNEKALFMLIGCRSDLYYQPINRVFGDRNMDPIIAWWSTKWCVDRVFKAQEQARIMGKLKGVVEDDLIDRLMTKWAEQVFGDDSEE